MQGQQQREQEVLHLHPVTESETQYSVQQEDRKPRAAGSQGSSSQSARSEHISSSQSSSRSKQGSSSNRNSLFSSVELDSVLGPSSGGAGRSGGLEDSDPSSTGSRSSGLQISEFEDSEDS